VSWYDSTRRSRKPLRKPAGAVHRAAVAAATAIPRAPTGSQSLEADHDTGVWLLHLSSSVCKLTDLVEIGRDEKKTAVSGSG
jgi:hypothetical protein